MHDGEATAPPSEVTLVWWGEIDLDNAHTYRTEMLAAVRAASAVFVDLTGVTFIDSLGLGVLVVGWKAAHVKGVAFAVSVPDGPVKTALRTAGLLELLNRPAR